MTDQELRDKLASEGGYTDGPGHYEGVAFRAGWDAARANDATLRNTAGYELGRRAVEVTENALHECQRERDEWKWEYENLCKFANDFELERDELKKEIERLKDAAEAMTMLYIKS